MDSLKQTTRPVSPIPISITDYHLGNFLQNSTFLINLLSHNIPFKLSQLIHNKQLMLLIRISKIGLLTEPHLFSRQFGNKKFNYVSPYLWNKLPSPLQKLNVRLQVFITNFSYSISTIIISSFVSFTFVYYYPYQILPNTLNCKSHIDYFDLL